jgi:excisionase family DNA binding protein
MSLAEAAESLGVTIDALRGAIHRGTFKAKKIGRNWTCTSKEVERYRVENLGRRGRKPSR